MQMCQFGKIEKTARLLMLDSCGFCKVIPLGLHFMQLPATTKPQNTLYMRIMSVLGVT